MSAGRDDGHPGVAAAFVAVAAAVEGVLQSRQRVTPANPQRPHLIHCSRMRGQLLLTMLPSTAWALDAFRSQCVSKRRGSLVA